MAETVVKDRKMFLEKADLIPPPCVDESRINTESYWDYLWDNYETEEEVNTLNKTAEGNYIYTIVDDLDNTSVLIEGIWRTNRMGYLISKVKVDIPDWGIEL